MSEKGPTIARPSSSESTPRRAQQFKSTRRLERTGTEKGTAKTRLVLAQDRRIEDNKYYEASGRSNRFLISTKDHIHRLEENRLSKCLCHIERRHVSKMANHSAIGQDVVVLKGEVARSHELLKSRIWLYLRNRYISIVPILEKNQNVSLILI